MTMCWKCGTALHCELPVGRSATCASCGLDVRSCRNCAHYSPGSYHDCAERVEDAVRDKEAANFCDYFRLNPNFRADRAPDSNASRSNPSGGSGRAAFNDLFGN